MRFLVDNQLPNALAVHLRRQGHDAIHVMDIGLDEAADADIWDYAATNQCVVVTKDEDFSDMLLFRQDTVPIVWVRLGNCRKPELLATFDRAMEQVISSLNRGETLIEMV